MNLSQKIVAALNDRNDESSVIEASAGDSRVSLKVRERSAVGVALDALDFTSSHRAEWSDDALSAWAQRIATRLTYLMEPLVLLEIDSIGGEVELRSQSLTRRGDLLSYYQIRLNRLGDLHFTRVVFDADSRRRVPGVCRFTLEALERLVDDLEASAAN